MIYPGKSEYLKLAEEYDVVPVYGEILADTETPVSVLRRFAENENVFLLESMEGGETWGRYSFIGVDPELLLETDHSPGRNGELEGIRDIYRNVTVAPVAGLPRFFGGAVGYIGYEAICEFEKMPPPRASETIKPRSRFLKADQIIVFDNKRHTVKIVVTTILGSKFKVQSSKLEEVYEEAISRIDAIVDMLKKPIAFEVPAVHSGIEFVSNMEEDGYRGMVEKAKKYIYDGDIIQAVLSQRFTAKADIPAIELYRALRLLNPSPYTFFIKMGSQTLVGSSPEVMVRLTGRHVELRPIAGTRPRASDEEKDNALEKELLADEKEKAEHVMLVDLGRNDIGRIAESGSVNVTEYMVIERYSHVMHLVSHVEGALKPEFDAYDVIKATFPAGTLSGAPKIRAMEIIHELEPSPRGVYGGAVGYISYSGNMDLAITIRTMEVENGTVSVQAGAGIVFDSDPQKELEETRHKARGMQKAVEMAAAGLEIKE